MKTKYSNKEILEQISNGNKDILLFLFEKYYRNSFKLLKKKGLNEKQQKKFFARVLAILWIEIRNLNNKDHIDAESMLYNILENYANKIFKDADTELIFETALNADELEISKVMADCVDVLDEKERLMIVHHFTEGNSGDKKSFTGLQPFINIFNRLAGIATIRLKEMIN